MRLAAWFTSFRRPAGMLRPAQADVLRLASSVHCNVVHGGCVVVVVELLVVVEVEVHLGAKVVVVVLGGTCPYS